MANCTDCGHCAELYTPKDTDPASLQEVRSNILNWMDGVLGSAEEELSMFLQK
jgi:hypothetical protein